MGPQGLPPNGYPGPQQWRGNEQQQFQHQPPPVPLSTQNYHPNYAPQVFGPGPQQPQYGPQQPQMYPPQGQYNQAPPMSHPQHQGPVGPQQWQGGQTHHPRGTHNNSGGRGRGRGGSRGGFEAPLMGPPIRMGFDSDASGSPMTQASTGYPPYSGPQQGSPIPFSQPLYQGQPQYQPYSPNSLPARGGRASLEPNPFNHGNRGRGGVHNRGNRRDQFNDRSRQRGGKQHLSGPNKPVNSSSNRATDLPQKPAADAGAKSGEKKKKKKKRKTNTLGLTPGTDEYQDSEEEEEDDVDEESKLAASILNGAEAKEPSDLAAWLEERRKKWPTKARIEQKDAEAAKRRQAAAEQSARDKAKVKQEKETMDASNLIDAKIEKQRKKAEKLRKQLERAEQKVQEAMKAGMKRKRDAGDYGDEDADADPSTKAEEKDSYQVITNATAAASLEDSDDSSEYTSGSSSDDDGPDATTTKRTAPVPVQPPPKKVLDRHCKYFSTGGICGKKGKCRFIHDQSVRDAALKEKELNGGRMTLAQRLTQNDKEKEDLMVLKAIKYLHERGHLDEPDAPVDKVPEVVDSHDISDHDYIDFNE